MFSVTLISECPMMYCRVFGLIPLFAMLEQKVCRHTWGVMFVSISSILALALSAQQNAVSVIPPLFAQKSALLHEESSDMIE